MPLSETLGNALPRKASLPVTLSVAMVLGVGVTFAEPEIGGERQTPPPPPRPLASHSFAAPHAMSGSAAHGRRRRGLPHLAVPLRAAERLDGLPDRGGRSRGRDRCHHRHPPLPQGLVAQAYHLLAPWGAPPSDSTPTPRWPFSCPPFPFPYGTIQSTRRESAAQHCPDHRRRRPGCAHTLGGRPLADREHVRDCRAGLGLWGRHHRPGHRAMRACTRGRRGESRQTAAPPPFPRKAVLPATVISTSSRLATRWGCALRLTPLRAGTPSGRSRPSGWSRWPRLSRSAPSSVSHSSSTL